MSGFTTTGATLLQDVEALSYSMQFWRCFTHWIGGMGILVFVTIISAKAPDRTMHILRAEMPGPTMDKIVPKARDGVKILYLIYIVLTLLEFAAFLLADMPIYDAIIHAMSTAGTGGFGMLNSSMAGYAPVCQWIVAFFMVLFAINFNLFFLIIMGQWRTALRSHELICFLSIIVVASGIIAFNIAPMYGAGDAVRHSFFQVAAIISTTGFATADYTTWPGLSQGIIFVLLFLGGCSGSTAGGLKISRIILLAQSIRREMQHVLHPRSTRVVRFENKKVDETIISSCNTYFTLYIVCIAVIFLLICWEPFGLTTNLSAVITCFNNVGPGFGIISPSGNYSAFSPFSKLVLSGAMLLGRLEIYPLLIAMTPTAWAKRR